MCSFTARGECSTHGLLLADRVCALTVVTATPGLGAIEAIPELGAAFGGRKPQPQLLWPVSLGGNVAQLAAPHRFDRSPQ